MLLAEVERALAGEGTTRRGGDLVLVACSGGADSVVLAHAAATLLGARRVVLGHVDHAVRPDSALDAAFVAAYARGLGAGFLGERLPTGPAAEARLRALRYAALARMRAAAGARLVLTAHTEDDQAETVLLALLRSARLGALRGIPARRADVVRPLLGVPRRVVQEYARAERLAWREDPSNREPIHLRNRVRKELLPLLERRYRPGMARRLARLAEEVRASAPAGPPAAPPARATSTPIRGTSGPRAGLFPTSTPEDEATAGPWTGPVIRWTRRPWRGGPLPDGRRSAVFDAETLASATLRGARAGDRVQPFGFSGHRKVFEVLRAARVPPAARLGYPVVAAADGAIVWVPGVLRSNVAPVRPLTRDVWVFWMDDGSAQLQGAPGRATLEAPGPRPNTGEDTRTATKGPGQDDE